MRSRRTDVPSSRGREYASRAFVAVLALAAGGAAVALVRVDPVQVNLGVTVGCLALVVGFGIARRLAIEIDVRRDTARITPTEIPLVIGLLFLPGAVVLVAYLSVVVIARLIRRDNWFKLLFNASYATLTVAVTALLAYLLNPDLRLNQDSQGLPLWSAVLAGFVVAHAITSCLTWAFFVLLDHRRPGESARPVVHIYLTGLLNAALGLAAAMMVQEVKWGWLLAGLLAVILAAVYRAYYGLLRDQRDLGVLNDFSLRVAGRGRIEDCAGSADGAGDKSADGQLELDEGGWSTAMELVREQLNATRVVLHRMPAEGTLDTVVAGQPLPRPLSHRDVSALLFTDPQAETGKVLHLVEDSHNSHDDPVIANALAVRNASELLVAPLRGADQFLGLIEVHDRQSRLRGFGCADVRLVETLASHLTTAIDNRRLLARLRHDAYHDNLTDLRNRLGFREVANEVLRRNSLSCAVIVIDLALLSSVNDALGHLWGDRIVQVAGERLHRALPGRVLAARLEGDTFAVLLVDVDEDEALTAAERVQAALSQPYPVDKLAVECSAVAGIALTKVEPTRNVDILLQRADVALHAARAGDATVRCYAPSMGQVFLRRFQLVTQFRQALDSGQVDVHFQPQLALLTRQVIGAEALVRWHHPEFGKLDPEEFVAIVEATGLIDTLTGFVLDRSLQQCREWLDRELSLSVAVNLSVRNLADTAFPERVAEALQRHRVPPELLGFELTESAVMSDPERALPVLRSLHGLGVRIAVDDFGTGYSSLSYLRRLPVDEVKIDKSFVLGLASDLGDLAVVRAIVDLGHSLGLTVVAEGVEEDATRDQLVEMGCDVAQGYLISRPLAAARFDAWLQTRTVRARGMRDETVLTLVR